MFIELHLIQNFAPSCLNRDDTNSPKDCVFGGVRRARISSQCVKRAMRGWAMQDKDFEDHLGVRTKRLHENLVDKLKKAGKTEEDSSSAAARAIELLGLKLDKENRSQYLLFLGQSEIKALCDVITTHWEAMASPAPTGSDEKEKKGKKKKSTDFPEDLKKAFDRVLTGKKAADVAMFGRMLADSPANNVDAACQVAHALSTHKVDMDMDFFTAVDDLKREDTSGADMMGTVEFNSACFYRYSVIHWEKLVENLGNDVELAKKTVKAFVNAAIHAIPTGKQNTFAAQNPPSLGFGLVRENAMPWSLANAFENPVRANGKGLVPASIDALAAYYRKLRDVYGDTPKVAVHFCVEEECACETLGEHKNVADFVDALVAALSEAAS